jgi:hypothetical protein
MREKESRLTEEEGSSRLRTTAGSPLQRGEVVPGPEGFRRFAEFKIDARRDEHRRGRCL